MKDIYIKFGKPLNGKEIKGESRDAGAGTQHAAPWFEAISWNHIIRQPKSATASTAGGHTAERCEHGEMIFTKDLDLVSPQLWEACSAGKPPTSPGRSESLKGSPTVRGVSAGN